MSSILDLLNGDSAVEPFRKSGLSSEQVMVWREVYTEGPLDGSESLDAFRISRAAFLHSFVREWTEQQILHGLVRMDSFVLSGRRNDTLRIWSDACMFDQMIVTRILFLVSTLPREERPAVELYADDVICGNSPDVFRALEQTRSVLSLEEIEAGASCWLHFTKNSVPHTVPRVFRYLRTALERRAAELPDSSGLGLTERRIVLIATEGVTPIELFHKLSELEQFPWFGDTTLWHLTDSLAERGFLTILDGRTGVSARLSHASPEALAFIRILPAAP